MIDEIIENDETSNEQICPISPEHSLKWRSKRQRLTFWEKAEIYKKINENVAIKDWIEMYQISYSTI